MDAGMANKPVVSVVNTHAQPVIAPVPAAPTELPGLKTVSPVATSLPPRNEPRRAHVAPQGTTHDAIIDPQTREVVFRILDANTRQILHQIPDRALLRAQAYARAQIAQALADGKNPHLTHSDSQHIDALT